MKNIPAHLLPSRMRGISWALIAAAMGSTIALVPSYAFAQAKHDVRPISNQSWAEGIGDIGAAPIVLAGLDSVAPRQNKIQTKAAVVTSTLSPASFDFGNVNLGFSNGTILTLTNISASPVYISAVSGSGPFYIYSSCPIYDPILSPSAYLGPSSSCDTNVYATPIVLGPASGMLEIDTDAGPQIATLAAYAVPPFFGPASFDFGSQIVGSVSDPQGFEILNEGNDYLRVVNIVSSGDEYALALSNQCPYGCDVSDADAISHPKWLPSVPGSAPTSSSIGGQQTMSSGGLSIRVMPKNFDIPSKAVGGVCSGNDSLFPGGSCVFSATFQPLVEGQRDGYIQVTSSGNFISTIPLTGVGVSGKDISVLPEKLDFGGVQVGATSPPQTFTVTDKGVNPVNITSVTIDPLAPKSYLERKVASDFAIVSHNCAALSETGSSCSGTVAFKPTDVGSRGANLRIEGDFEGSPFKVPIQGTGTAKPVALLTFSATSIGFGQISFGGHASPVPVTITNSGTLSVNISSIYATGDFSESNNCPATLPPAGTCTATIGFNPSLPGTRNGNLVVVNDSQTGTAKLSLEGTACRLFTLRGARFGQAFCSP
jgi:hypothetical protein